MNPNYLTRAELADFGLNMAAKIAEGKVTGLLPGQVTAISDAIAAASAKLAESDRRQVALRAASLEGTQIAQDDSADLQRLIQDFKYTMKGLGSRASEFDAVGFDPPVIGRRPVTPETPVELAVTGYSNGVNALSFVSANAPGRVLFVIEAKIADIPRYDIIGSTKSQKFKHTGVKPGVPIQYRVRSQAARGQTSTWSNEAVVYRE